MLVLVSETRMNRFLSSANFALDLAAPMEGACAPFHHFLHFSFVAATAAHEVTTVHTDRCLVANATLRPRDAQFEILLAEIGRVLVVDQIFSRRSFMIGIVRFQLVVVLFATDTGDTSCIAD